MSSGTHRTGTREMQGFETHRCELMPEGYSLRKYDHPSLYRDGWRLADRELDSEWMEYFLEDFAAVTYCPWCGRRLD